MVKKGDTFNIGEVCPESGVYRLKNCEKGTCFSRSEEQTTIPLSKGEKFPPCRNCKGTAVKWEFVQKA